VRIHPASYVYLAGLSIAALGCAFLLPVLIVPIVLLGLGLAWFFRDPHRTIPETAGILVSPADGRVFEVARNEPNPFDGATTGEFTRVSIFLSLINVHINRVPCDATVIRLKYIPGRFHHAGTPQAVKENERQLIELNAPGVGTVIVVQSSGALVRKIVCNLVPGQQVKRGERFGLIKFGSRTDIYLPQGTIPAVAVGAIVKGGETVVGKVD
jgi:phosphatidylserine decarboxylase